MLLRILIALIVLAPLPFGATVPWAWALLATLVGLLLLSWAVQTAISSNGLAVPLRRLWFPLCGATAVAAWMLAQISTATPAGWHHPLWKSASEVLGRSLPGSISIVPFDTASTLLLFLTYVAIFWIAVQSCRASNDARAVIFALGIAGGVYAAYGLYVEFSGTARVLWFDKERYRDSLTSTFLYKNAYATYAGLGALCTIGLLLQGLERIAEARFGRRESLRRTAMWLGESGWFLIALLVVLVSALVMSKSRAGALCFVVGLTVLLLCARAIRGVRIPYLGYASATLAIALVGSLAINHDGVLDRLGKTDLETDARPTIYGATIRAIGDAPLLGTGAGTFEEVFSMYRPSVLASRPAYAHSSYLENALELGIPAAVLLTLTIAAPGVICVLGVRRRRRNGLYPCIGIAATVFVGLHATIDFTLQIPAVAATYALLMGAACAQSWSSQDG